MGWVVLVAMAWATPRTFVQPVSGTHGVDVDIDRFGRFAIEVRSEQGAALQVVDRMAGPGARHGVVGSEDGRHDLFADVGQIRVLTHGPNGATGDLRVVVTPFERQGDVRVLVPERAVTTRLRDRTERAWWVEHDATRPLQFEVVGRHVGDLRLWRDGTWLVDASPRCRELEPVVGQPVQQCILNADAEPGLYQLVAYGAPGSPWAEEAADDGLEIRWGLRSRGASGQLVGRIGPTGRTRFRVDASVDVAHVALEEHAPVGLHLQTVGDDPFSLGSPEASITDESRTPTATATSRRSGQKVVAVEGPPGTRFTLSWFDTANSRVVLGEQTFLSGLSTRRWQDDFPPTAVVTRQVDGRTLLVEEVALSVSSGQRFAKRANLLAPYELLLRVRETATHQITVEGTPASIRVEPYVTSPAEDQQSPPARPSTWQESLQAGLYKVTITPLEPGIATLRIQRNDWGDLAQRAVADLTPVTLPPELRMKVVRAGDAPHTLRIFGPSTGKTGLHVTTAPLTLDRPHPIALRAGESYAVPVQTDRPTTIRAVRPDGEPLELELAGRRATQLEVPAGSWPVTLHNPGDPVVASVQPVPAPYEAPALPADRLGALPDFPTLAASRPHFQDLGRRATTTLQLEVGRDGLYHLQSTGLLATRGSLRSRVTTDLGTGDQNGVGRNFRVARYLRSGTYQVTVGTIGDSAGHLGIELAEAPMVDGGTLALDETARATLPPETGIAYRLEVPARQAVRVRSEGVGRAFPCRLEDADGWPVVAPATSCDLELSLDAGSYVLRSLPSDVETKRTTRIERRPAPRELVGHGPFPIPLGERIAKDWVEPVGDGERPHDRFTFALPAEDQVSIALSAEMRGDLLRDDETVGRLVPGRSWSGRLPAGDYTVRVQGVRRGTGIPYTLQVHTEALQVGQTRSVRSPNRIPVAIGTAGLVTLRSRGNADVRARLLDAEGRLVAANDDRPDGWDFQIATWLEPGVYQLDLAHVGRRYRTDVILEAPREVVGAPIRAGRRSTSLPVDAVPRVHPLELAGRKQLVAVSIQADQNVGVALEIQRADGGWTSLGDAQGRAPTFLGRRPSGADARLRIWSVDGRSGTATVAVDTPSEKTPSATALAEGIAFDGVGAVRAKSARPGLYRVLGDRSQVQVCPAEGQPCRPAGSVVAMDEDTIVSGPTVRLARVDLTEPTAIELASEPRLLDTGRTGLIALIARSGDHPPDLRMTGDHATATGRGASMAVGSGRIAVWGDGGARLQAVTLEPTRRAWDGREELRLALQPRSALTLLVDDTRRTYPVALQDGVYARIGAGALWADGQSVQGHLLGSEELLLANPTDETRFATLAPPIATGAPLTPDSAREWFAIAPGAHLLPVAPGSGTLRVHDGTLLLRRSDGTLAMGTSVEAGAGGAVEVRHGAGWNAVWSEVGRPGPHATATRLVELTEPGVHRLTADGPFAAAIDAPGRQAVVLRPEGGSVDVIVGDAPVTVGIRPLGDQPDVLLRTRMLLVPTIGEGLGPSVLVEGGQDVWFRFQVDEDGPVGVGARASADRVVARIVAPDGTEHASGVVARADLTPGTWYLVLGQPTGMPPVDVQPAVVGLDRPDTGPPADVVRDHLQRAGLRVDGGTP
jgi:hypothetical protein